MACRPPPPALLASSVGPSIRYLADAVNRTWLPSVSCTSWWRTPSVNTWVGGSPESQHLYGLAVDLVGDRADLGTMAQQLSGLGLVPVFEDDHLHVQVYPRHTLVDAGFPFPPPRWVYA